MKNRQFTKAQARAIVGETVVLRKPIGKLQWSAAGRVMWIKRCRGGYAVVILGYNPGLNDGLHLVSVNRDAFGASVELS
jgi:hypothetical protein